MKQTKSNYNIQRKNHVFDASGQSVGRLATQIAKIIMGKNKADYTPQVDNGDFVTVNNAKNLKLTGNKINQKQYYSHSMYPGGLKIKKASELLEKDPGQIIKYAVYNMLPEGKKRTIIKRLTINN